MVAASDAGSFGKLLRSYSNAVLAFPGNSPRVSICLWLALAGRCWLALAGSGWLWLAFQLPITGHGWLALAGSGWLALAGPRWYWLVLVGSNMLWWTPGVSERLVFCWVIHPGASSRLEVLFWCIFQAYPSCCSLQEGISFGVSRRSIKPLLSGTSGWLNYLRAFCTKAF